MNAEKKGVTGMGPEGRHAKETLLEAAQQHGLMDAPGPVQSAQQQMPSREASVRYVWNEVRARKPRNLAAASNVRHFIRQCHGYSGRQNSSRKTILAGQRSFCNA